MKLLSFQQTPFITHEGYQRVRLEVTDWDFCNPFRVRCLIDGQVAADFEHFKNYAVFLLPEQKKDTECLIELTPFEDIPVLNRVTLHPVKHWLIPILYSSHEDLGYCAYANKLEYQFYEYTNRAITMCEEQPDFYYVIEHTEWLRSFLYFASPAEKDKLTKYVREGRIELCAIPCGVHTSWADGEQLIRSLHEATEKGAKQFGIHPETIVFADLSGVSWQAVSAYAGQGIRYLVILDNGFRKPSRAGDPPKFFKWLAPNGKDSLFCWYPGTSYRDDIYPVWNDTNRQYPEGTFRFDDTHADLTADYFTNKLEKLGDVPFHVCPISYYDDHEYPNSQLLTICRGMGERWRYPEFKLATPGSFLKEIEEALGENIPVLKGEINDQWADFATIAPRWLADKREAMRLTAGAELLSTMRCVEKSEAVDTEGKDETVNAEDKKAYVFPNREIEEIFRNADRYDEHCWATSSKHPQKMHIFNLNFVKRFAAESALSESQRIILEALEAEKGIDGGKNMLPYAETFSLHLPPKNAIPAGIASQTLRDGSIITEPVAFGPLEEKAFCAPSGSKTVFLEGDSFETPFYRVSLDRRTEKITQIYEINSGRKLLDENAPYPLGTFLYSRNEMKESPDLAIEIPKRRGMNVEEGPVATIVTIYGYEEQSGADTVAEFRFSRFEPTITLELSYDNAGGLLGDYADRYKKNIFYSFPFIEEKPYTFLTQLPGGKAYAVEEKIPACPLDFSVAEHWTALSGEGRGIALYSFDAPVFHFGEIQYNRFSTDLSRTLSHPHIYLYAASNRTNNLNLRTVEDCCGRFRMAILPYTGRWQDTLPDWERRLTAPPVPVHTKANRPSFSLDHKLRLLSFRPLGEDSILLRVAEDKGENLTSVTATLPFEVSEAWYATLTGEKLSKAESAGNKVTFAVDAWSYATLVIKGQVSFKAQAPMKETLKNIVLIPIENARAIVCFEKTANCQAKAFRVVSFGQVLAEAPNDLYRVQTIELSERPHDFTVEEIL